ncbi:MAG: hypothetical protein AB8B67_02500 [Rickettsiaceae bacterium]
MNNQYCFRYKTTPQYLRNALISLAISGLYSIIIVLMRSPLFPPNISSYFFKVSLVVHVNLSVFVWMISILHIIWSIYSNNIFLQKICCNISLISITLIAISPFTELSEPIMSNYIPMLDNNLIFALGMGLFGASTLTLLINTIYDFISSNECKDEIINAASISSAIIFLVAVFCFSMSYFSLEQLISLTILDSHLYFELLFWSMGHALQFLYSNMYVAVLIILVRKILNEKLYFNKIYQYLFFANSLFCSFGLFGNIVYEIYDSDFKDFYTMQMIYFGSISAIITIILLLYEICTGKATMQSKNCVSTHAVICSSLLFLFGGVIGALIREINVTIPAHYHGSVVGITIGFMGFCYYLQNIKAKIATWQIYILSIGQSFHILGLLIAGGYGVARKTPGATEMSLIAKIAMGIMGIGGLIAILGGLMFVIICSVQYHKARS